MTKDLILMTAAEARAKLNAGENLAAQTQLLKIRTLISEALEAGRSYVPVYHFEAGVETQLEALGYKIRYRSAPVSSDWRDRDYYEVSW